MTRMWTCVAATIALGSSLAHADVESDNAKIALNELNQALKHPAPGPGLDKASPQAAPWCARAKPVSGINYNWIRRDLEQYQSQSYWAGLIKLAGEVCSADQRQPVMHALNADILQYWINLTGLSAKNAVASLSVRVDVEAFKAEKAKLCEQLKVSDEVSGEDAELMKARRMLFGCQMDEAGWAETRNTERELIEYLDQGASETDELVRLAYVVDKAGAGLREHDDYFDHRFAPYAIWAIDFKTLDDGKALKAVQQAPYNNSAYAVTVVRETLGRAHMGIAVLDAEAKKHASDADWKELLFDAPATAIDAYSASAAKYKDEIQRSNEAERKMFGPSKKASAGCEPTLRKDLLTVFKAQKHATQNEALESLSDPVLGLLFSRYVACLAIDAPDAMYARRMWPVMEDLRHGRGVRMAAYYAILEALGKISKDREKFVVKVEDFRNVMPTGHALSELASNAASGRPAHDAMAFIGDKAKGVVKSATKSGDLVVVTFQTKKHQEMTWNCVDTNRLMSIDSNGRLHYYQRCSEAGMTTVNDTPAPVSIPVLYADKITAGSVVEIDTTRGKDAKERWGFPVAVYADAGKKKLVNWFGFAL